VLGRLAHPSGGIVQQPEQMENLGRGRLALQSVFAARKSLIELALVCKTARLLDPMFGWGRVCGNWLGYRLGVLSFSVQ
jgi:hypothetical protein